MRRFDPTVLLAAVAFGIALPVFAFDTKAEMQTAPPVEREAAYVPPPVAVPARDENAAVAVNAMYATAAAERRAKRRDARIASFEERRARTDMLRAEPADDGDAAGDYDDAAPVYTFTEETPAGV